MIHWTNKQQAYLAREYLSGVSIAEIADKMGRTRGAVYMHAHRMGLCVDQKWSDAAKEKLRLGWGRGDSLAVIAADTGRSEKAVQDKRRSMGLAPRRG